MPFAPFSTRSLCIKLHAPILLPFAPIPTRNPDIKLHAPLLITPTRNLDIKTHIRREIVPFAPIPTRSLCIKLHAPLLIRRSDHPTPIRKHLHEPPSSCRLIMLFEPTTNRRFYADLHIKLLTSRINLAICTHHREANPRNPT